MRELVPEPPAQLLQEPKEVRLPPVACLKELLDLEEQRSPKLLLQLAPEEKSPPRWEPRSPPASSPPLASSAPLQFKEKLSELL